MIIDGSAFVRWHYASLCLQQSNGAGVAGRQKQELGCLHDTWHCEAQGVVSCFDVLITYY